MGIIRLTGKILEISGKIIQADAVEQWLEDKGKELLEQWVIKKGVEALSAEEQKDQVVEALRKPLHSRPFAKAIDTTFDEFLNAASEICGAVWSASSFGKDTTLLLPTDLVQDCALSLVERRISSWAEFKRLYDSDLLRQAFFEEWRTNAVKAIRKSSLSPENPFELGEGFRIVLIDDSAFWSEKMHLGAFYIHRSSQGEMSEGEHKQILRHIESLDRKRGRFRDSELEENLKFFNNIKNGIEKYQPNSAATWQLLGIVTGRTTLGADG